MAYRPYIDGLRAIAVAAIVAFHVSPSLLPGGFLGVDSFFVISGYLITSVILKEHKAGTFSVLDFYRRRVVRILPALFVMLIVTCAVASRVLLPDEMRALSASAAAAAGFGSNIFFWREAAYFGGLADGRPLLHTWSLSVEEQFYLGFPLLLPLLLRRTGRTGALLTMAALAGASLALCMALGRSNPVPVFYLLPFRVWELGIGVCAALIPSRAHPQPRVGAALAAIGLLGTVFAFVLATPDAASQQAWALLACAGTALALMYGAEGLPARVLSARPFRRLGLWSYSLYLWHWPIISLYRISYSFELAAGEAVTLVACSLLAAGISYHFVEQPFRRGFRTGPAAPAVASGLMASLLITGAALLLQSQADHLRSFPPRVKQIAAYSDYWRWPRRLTPIERRCAAVSIDRRGPIECPARVGQGNVLLAGDSHARHIRRALAMRFEALHFISVIGHGCRPILGSPGPKECTQPFEKALTNLVAARRVQAVVLAAQWQDRDVEHLSKSIGAIRGHGVRVLVVGPVVEYNGSFPSLLARAMWTGDERWLDRSRRRSREVLDRRMEEAARAAGAAYFSPYRRECPDDRCQHLSHAGEPLHFDYGHYTFSGSTDIVAGLEGL